MKYSTSLDYYLLYVIHPCIHVSIRYTLFSELLLAVLTKPFGYTVPTGSIILALPQTVSVTEGSAFLTGFGIEGQAIEDIPFSLRPLTYRQFEIQSGLIVTDIFSDVPTAASISMSDIIVYNCICTKEM